MNPRSVSFGLVLVMLLSAMAMMTATDDVRAVEDTVGGDEEGDEAGTGNETQGDNGTADDDDVADDDVKTGGGNDTAADGEDDRDNETSEDGGDTIGVGDDENKTDGGDHTDGDDDVADGEDHTDGDDDVAGGDEHTDGDDAAEEKDDIVGEWTATDQDDDEWSFDFQDDGDYVIDTPDGTYKGTYTVDETADPPTMDLLITEAPEGFEEYVGNTSKAIYQVDDGSLQISLSQPGGERPASFTEDGPMNLQGSHVTPPEDEDDDDGDTPGFGATLLLGAMGLLAVAMLAMRRRRF